MANVNVMNLITKQSIFLEYILLQKKHLSFARAHMQKITKLYHNQPGETSNQTNLHLEPHIYPIYYVNIDLRHQYGISVAESQTFLLVKRSCWRGARRNGCICRLQLTYRYQNNVWVKPSAAHLYQNIDRVVRPPTPLPLQDGV